MKLFSICFITEIDLRPQTLFKFKKKENFAYVDLLLSFIMFIED